MKQKKLVKKITFGITICCLTGLMISTYQINKLTRKIEVDITNNRAELEKQKNKLTELKQEVKEMESTEYIERVAREQLGMVDSDTIIIRAKP
ncbi:FtsB family cell division protein [Cellulosilyticum ruminicola]|uniref:FtsB family cell division protein n=1 Tax=Cellulosilyticum ruminicola TaxID=425254 RepID=UPI0006D1E426|nr:septum formation initiator family protein [Cellulosilyticum ruminicola]